MPSRDAMRAAAASCPKVERIRAMPRAPERRRDTFAVARARNVA